MKATTEYIDTLVRTLNETHMEYEFGAMRGPKYTRITQCSHGRRSVFMFIDNETGFFLKSAGWKAPAKGFRFTPSTLEEAQKILRKSDPYGGFLYLR